MTKLNLRATFKFNIAERRQSWQNIHEHVAAVFVNALRAQNLAGGHFLGHQIRLVFVFLSI